MAQGRHGDTGPATANPSVRVVPSKRRDDGSHRLTPHDYELLSNLKPPASLTPRPWRAVANHALSPVGRAVVASKIVGTNSTDIPALWTTTNLEKSLWGASVETRP
jgi:hypothetical protein